MQFAKSGLGCFAVALSLVFFLLSCKSKLADVAQVRSEGSGLAIGVGETVCFREPVILLDGLLAEGTTELDVDVVNSILTTQQTQACSEEVASALNNSSMDIALAQQPDQSFGLMNKQVARKLTGLLGIRRLDDLSGLLSRIRLRLSNGMNVLVNIVRHNTTGLISSAVRAKLLPESMRLSKYVGPRFVQAKVLEPTRYNLVMKSLEQHRADYFAKFDSWLLSQDAAEFIIKSDQFIISSRDPIVRSGMDEIFKLMSSPKTIFRHLQDLEMDIAKRMATKGEKMEDALEAILTAQEKKHGFQAAVDLTGSLTREHLRTPALFRDKYFSAGSYHGQQIHRIQWYAVTRHLDQSALKGKINGAKLYTAFGEGVSLKNSDNWAEGWNALFDGFSGNLGRPENWRGWLTDFLPTLAGWP